MSEKLKIVFLLGSVFFGSFANAQDSESALANLEGAWAVVSIVENGESVPKERFNGFIFRFNAKNLTWLAANGKKIDSFTVSVDATEQPIALDLVQTRQEVEDDEGKPKTTFAIYELKNDSLRICLPRRGEKKRPSSFESESGSFLSVIVLKRVKQDTSDTGRTKP